MTAPYLLPPADLHAAAPGVLDVVFGPDGDFEGAPEWTPPMWSEKLQCWGHPRVGAAMWFVDEGALDLRIPSVAARLAGLCARAGYPDLSFQDNEVIAQARYGGPSWNEAWAVRLAALTLALAPRIAAFRP